MKNIHVLRTDKPSRLVIPKYSEKLLLADMLSTSKFNKKFNLYITSDEEIKEGDWVIDEDYDKPLLYKADKSFFDIGKEAKKIILTTDQDLISDGIAQISEDVLLKIVEHINSGKNIESFDEL